MTYLEDNCIQIFHLGRYIVGYTSPNENFEYGYSHSNALLTFSLQKDSENVLCCAYTSSDVSCIKPLASCIYSLVNQWKATLRNDVGFPTVYRRIYCRKFMTLSNQTLRCICKRIRILVIILVSSQLLLLQHNELCALMNCGLLNIGGFLLHVAYSTDRWRFEGCGPLFKHACLMGTCTDSKLLHTDSEDSDQTGGLSSLNNENTRWVCFYIKFTRQGFQNAC